ncbi:MAG: hypothetical protein COB38_00480 [Gammaproteobacteria bacterium]|nr:MAG: hypothetical protein COB38_00480 [Gammaproteobacteria bacterium]
MSESYMVSNLSKTVLVCIFVVTALGCSFIPPTTSDYDVDYNFSNLKSYAWIAKRSQPDKESDSNKVDTKAIMKTVMDVTTLRQKRQISAVESILSKKGFVKSDSLESADFLVRSHNVTDKKKDVSTYYSVWGYYPYYHSPYLWPHRVSNSIEREYEVGTQVLDIVDAKTREVIWQGSVSQKLGFYKNQTPERRNQRIIMNVELMLKTFPPETVK